MIYATFKVYLEVKSMKWKHKLGILIIVSEATVSCLKGQIGVKVHVDVMEPMSFDSSCLCFIQMNHLNASAPGKVLSHIAPFIELI